MDWIGKVLDFIAKYSWAVVIATAFVLFIPSNAADQIGISTIRDDYGGFLWIIFVLSGAIWLAAVYRYMDGKFSIWLQSRQTAEQRREKIRQRREMLARRLESLDEGERLWIKYCLYHNVQTLSAERTDRIAQSLTYKRLLREGSGHILDLPFHIPDDVWEYLKENEDQFLTDAERQDGTLEWTLNKFRRARHA